MYILFVFCNLRLEEGLKEDTILHWTYKKIITSQAAKIEFEKVESLEIVCPTQQTVGGAMYVIRSKVECKVTKSPG